MDSETQSMVQRQNQKVHWGHPSRAEPAVEERQEEFRWAPVFSLGDRKGGIHRKEPRPKITTETDHRACAEGSF